MPARLSGGVRGERARPRAMAVGPSGRHSQRPIPSDPKSSHLISGHVAYGATHLYQRRWEEGRMNQGMV